MGARPGAQDRVVVASLYPTRIVGLLDVQV